MRARRNLLLLVCFVASLACVNQAAADILSAPEQSKPSSNELTDEKQKDLLIYKIMILTGVQTRIDFLVKNMPEMFYGSILPNTTTNGVDILAPEFRKKVGVEYNSRSPELVTKLRADVTAYYRERYSVEELQAILDFCLSPAGRKYRDDSEDRTSKLSVIMSQAFREFSSLVQKQSLKKR